MWQNLSSTAVDIGALWGKLLYPMLVCIIPLTLSLPLFFVLKLSSAFYIAAYIQVHVRLDFIMEANTMYPDQTAPLGAV